MPKTIKARVWFEIVRMDSIDGWELVATARTWKEALKIHRRLPAEPDEPLSIARLEITDGLPRLVWIREVGGDYADSDPVSRVGDS